jgi:GTPase SAR1 family protein
MANLPSFLKEDFGIEAQAQAAKLVDIAVIGSRGCGKTSFVQNAVRAFFPRSYNEAFLRSEEKSQ